MRNILLRVFRGRGEEIKRARAEAEKEQRLRVAESDLNSLQERAAVVANKIEARQRRNHWQEAIDEIIRGARA